MSAGQKRKVFTTQPDTDNVTFTGNVMASYISGPYDINVKVTGSVAVVTITARSVAVISTSGLISVLSNVNFTMNIIPGTAGLGSHDVGTIQNNTKYYIWLLYNPVTTAKSAVLSLSNDPDTVLGVSLISSAGYTFARLVGVTRTTNTTTNLQTILIENFSVVNIIHLTGFSNFTNQVVNFSNVLKLYGSALSYSTVDGNNIIAYEEGIYHCSARGVPNQPSILSLSKNGNSTAWGTGTLPNHEYTIDFINGATNVAYTLQGVLHFAIGDWIKFNFHNAGAVATSVYDWYLKVTKLSNNTII